MKIEDIDENGTCAGTSVEQFNTCSVSHVNKLVYIYSDSYMVPSNNALQDYDELDVDEQIAKIQPQLWNAISH